MPKMVSRTFAGMGTTIQTAAEQADSTCSAYLSSPLPYKEIVAVASSTTSAGDLFVHTITIVVREHAYNLGQYVEKDITHEKFLVEE